MEYRFVTLGLALLFLSAGCEFGPDTDGDDDDDDDGSGDVCCAYSMTTSGLGSSGTPTTRCSCAYSNCDSIAGSDSDCYEGSCVTTRYSNVREVEECESILAADDCTPGVIECLGGEYYKECLSFGEWSVKKTCYNKCDLFSPRYDCVDGKCVCF